MPYADPTRSPYCAARHLLRQIGNAHALRRNPILQNALGETAASDGDLLNAAQALVNQAFAAMDASSAALKLRRRARHAAILLRCDVLRESRAAVARDLGLSLPQFERERRAAMDRLVSYFQNPQSNGTPRVQSVRSGLARTVRDRAMRLADSGDRQSALTLLDNIVRVGSPREKIRALISVAEIETNERATKRSRAALESAAALLRSEDKVQAEVNPLWFAYEAAALRIQTIEHGPQAAMASLRIHNDLPMRPESISLLLAQAEVLDANGMAKEFRPFVSQALAIQREVPEVDAALRFDLAVLRSQLQFWLDPTAKGRMHLEEAISLAQTEGYSGRAFFGNLSRLGGQWSAAGDLQARREYRALIDRIGTAGEAPRITRFFSYWDAADMECALGNPHRAADAARKALALAPNAQQALKMKALLARAFARAGRFEMSERLSHEIIAQPGSSSTGTALFSAKRTLAYVCSFADRPKETWEHLIDAAELAPRYGTARVAAKIDETITKSRKQRVPSVSIIF